MSNNYASFPSIERLENIYCVISEKVDGCIHKHTKEFHYGR